jgi:hypothetical protein
VPPGLARIKRVQAVTAEHIEAGYQEEHCHTIELRRSRHQRVRLSAVERTMVIGATFSNDSSWLDSVQ